MMPEKKYPHSTMPWLTESTPGSKGRYISIETLKSIIRQVYNLGHTYVDITEFEIKDGKVVGCYLKKYKKW